VLFYWLEVHVTFQFYLLNGLVVEAAYFCVEWYGQGTEGRLGTVDLHIKVELVL
jgi:hypothetical protein